MTLTLIVLGLVLAPPTGWLLGAWLADLLIGMTPAHGERHESAID